MKIGGRFGLVVLSAGRISMEVAHNYHIVSVQTF